MPLDTQSFGLSRYQLETALARVPSDADIFSAARLPDARKGFLAGKNQLAAIKNWLVGAGVIELGRARASLTELGDLMAAKDERAEDAWTWWLVHLHLCANADTAPYSTFFTGHDPASTTWIPFANLVEQVGKRMCETGNAVEAATVKTYLTGVEQSFRAGWPLHDLKLLEHRVIDGDGGRARIRRCITRPPDIVIAYATLLFHQAYFPQNNTVEARVLLERGVAKALGVRDQTYRDGLSRIHQDSKLSIFLEYRRAVNLDSVQFVRIGAPALRQLRVYAYSIRDVQWP
jgi:hypothetical protein